MFRFPETVARIRESRSHAPRGNAVRDALRRLPQRAGPQSGRRAFPRGAWERVSLAELGLRGRQMTRFPCDRPAFHPIPVRWGRCLSGREFGASPGFAILLLMLTLTLGRGTNARAQLPLAKSGEVIPRDVREMYDRGAQFLASSQTENGDWPSQGGEAGPGTIGLAVMAFLASGKTRTSAPTATTCAGRFVI